MCIRDREQRAEAANRYGADAFVSIHQNTYEEEEPTGIETWYDGTDPSRDSRRLALLIHEETVKRTGAKAVSYTHLDVYKRQRLG